MKEDQTSSAAPEAPIPKPPPQPAPPNATPSPPSHDAIPGEGGDGFPALPPAQEAPGDDVDAVLRKYGLDRREDREKLTLKDLLRLTDLTQNMVAHLVFYCGLREWRKPGMPRFSKSFFKIGAVKKAIRSCKLLPGGILPETTPRLLRDVGKEIGSPYPSIFGRLRSSPYLDSAFHVIGTSTQRRCLTTAVSPEVAEYLIRICGQEADPGKSSVPKQTSKNWSESSQRIPSDEMFQWAENFPVEWFRRAGLLSGHTVEVGLSLWRAAAESPLRIAVVDTEQIAQEIGRRRNTVNRAIRVLEEAKLAERGPLQDRKTVVRIFDVPPEPAPEPVLEPEVGETENSDLEPYVNAAEVAKFLGESEEAVIAAAEDGVIPVHRSVLGLKFRLSEVDRVINRASEK